MGLRASAPTQKFVDFSGPHISFGFRSSDRLLICWSLSPKLSKVYCNKYIFVLCPQNVYLILFSEVYMVVLCPQKVYLILFSHSPKSLSARRPNLHIAIFSASLPLSHAGQTLSSSALPLCRPLTPDKVSLPAKLTSSVSGAVATVGICIVLSGIISRAVWPIALRTISPSLTGLCFSVSPLFPPLFLICLSAQLANNTCCCLSVCFVCKTTVREHKTLPEDIISLTSLCVPNS